MKRIFLAAVCAGALIGQPLWAKEPLRLAPSTKWYLDYENDSRVIARNFGTGEDTVSLRIEMYGPGDSFWVSLFGKPAKILNRKAAMRLRFGPLEAEQDVSYFPANAKNGTPGVFFRESIRVAPLTDAQQAYAKKWGDSPQIEPIGPAREKSVTELSVGGATKQDVVLELGSMGNVFQSMRTRTDDLVKSWGFDSAIAQAPSTLTAPQTWIRPSEYPSAKLWGGELAIVHFRLAVDAQGMPTDCHIQGALGGPEFTKAVCDKVMARARFKPAFDRKLTPVPYYYANSATFVIEAP